MPCSITENAQGDIAMSWDWIFTKIDNSESFRAKMNLFYQLFGGRPCMTEPGWETLLAYSALDTLKPIHDKTRLIDDHLSESEFEKLLDKSIKEKYDFIFESYPKYVSQEVSDNIEW